MKEYKLANQAHTMCAGMLIQKLPANQSGIVKSIYVNEFGKLPSTYTNHDELDYAHVMEVLMDEGFSIINADYFYTTNKKTHPIREEYRIADKERCWTNNILVINDKCMLSIEVKYSGSATTTRNTILLSEYTSKQPKKKEEQKSGMLFVNTIEGYAGEDNRDYVLGLFEKMSKYEIKFNEGNSINIIVTEANGELGTTSMDMPPVELDIEMNYGSGFLKVHDTIVSALRSEKSGLILLHGVPGTGKTNYIKYLIANTECPILYIPPHMVNTLADPGFITFIMNYENCVLVIEDAENAIQARTGEYTSPAVSNLLNMSDGILGAALKLKIIATFNSPKSSIDEALLRPGRLIAEHCFDKLGVDEANTLLGHLNKAHVATEDMTLAEIYNVDNMPAGMVKKNSKIGF